MKMLYIIGTQWVKTSSIKKHSYSSSILWLQADLAGKKKKGPLNQGKITLVFRHLKQLRFPTKPEKIQIKEKKNNIEAIETI